MCGIVGYIGHRESCPIVLKGLARLEYRGYDSAGLALISQGLHIYKKAGKVQDLVTLVAQKSVHSHVGMGHTRWATHGVPNDVNAHPHRSASGKLAIIHNGIIENYNTLQQELANKGYAFQSDTDTEVLINFIEDIQISNQCSLEEAVRLALPQVVGAYAIIMMSEELPNTLIAAKKSSPLVVGIGESEFFIASDATPILEYTNQVVYLQDDEIAVVQGGKLFLSNTKNVPVTPYIQQLEMELAAIEKSGFEHFMLKEIFEQPNSIADCMRGRIDLIHKRIKLGGVEPYLDQLACAPKINIIACGTSWLAGMVAKYVFEELCRIPINVEYASEFRYRNPIIEPGDIMLAISQSGETADTLAAVKLAQAQGATVLGICNVVGSSIARAAQAGIYTHAGPEIGVASTKAFTAQLTVLMLLALSLARQRNTISDLTFETLLEELAAIPSKVKSTIEQGERLKELAYLFKDATNFLYLGRGYNYPVALEGALKLKELSYIHAEGYPAAEMKHGPIALIDQDMPVVFIATQDRTYEKIISNIQEVKARKGRIIAIVTQGDQQIKSLVEHVIEVPATPEALMPLIAVIPLQLLAYYIAVEKGCNVDQPRNLAKSVTVE